MGDDNDMEDGEILEGAQEELEEDLAMSDSELYETELRSITVTLENVDDPLIQKQATFESCLTKFLASARKEVTGLDEEGQGGRVSSSGSGWNGHGHSKKHRKNEGEKIKPIHGKCKKGKEKSKFRQKKVKHWVKDNHVNFPQVDWKRKVTKKIFQEVQTRSPDDLRNKLDAMRSSRNSGLRLVNCAEPSYKRTVQMKLVPGNEVCMDIDNLDNNNNSGLHAQRIDFVKTEMEIAQTDCELEWIIAEAQLLNSRNDALQSMQSNMAKNPEYSRSCKLLETNANYLRRELTKLRKKFTEENRVKSQSGQLFAAKTLFLEKKAQYLTLKKECESIGKMLIGPNYCLSNYQHEQPVGSSKSFKDISATAISSSSGEHHEDLNSRNSEDKKSLTSETAGTTPAPAVDKIALTPSDETEAEHPESGEKEIDDNDNLAEIVPIRSQPGPTLPMQTAASGELRSYSPFTDILKQTITTSTSKLLRYEKYQSCLFGSLAGKY